MVKCIEHPAHIGLCRGKRNADREGSRKILKLPIYEAKSWKFPDQQNMPKIRKKIALRCETPKEVKLPISPQISGRVESLRLNASASVPIWYAQVDPTIVSFWCYHVATCFAFKLCAWHVVPQHKGCNKIGNRRPNLCTWLEGGFHRIQVDSKFQFYASISGHHNIATIGIHAGIRPWTCAMRFDAFRTVLGCKLLTLWEAEAEAAWTEHHQGNWAWLLLTNKHTKVQTVTNSKK